MNDELHRRERILRQRADSLARLDQIEASRTVLFQIAIVSVGGESFGIPVNHLKQLVRPPPITPLPSLPPWFVGVTHIRGEIISVVHMARWLGAPEDVEPSCLAVLQGPLGSLGMLVDRNAGFRDIYENDIVGDLEKLEDRPFVHRMTHDLVSILDVPAVLADPRLVFGSIQDGDNPPTKTEGH